MSQEKMTAKVERAVLRGVRLLDKRDPLWWNGADAPAVIEGMVGHIDLETLDLSDCRSCVLGQRAGRGFFAFEDASEALGLDYDGAARHGFNSSELTYTEARRAEFSALTEAWASVIQSRRYPRRAIARTPFAIEANRTWKRA